MSLAIIACGEESKKKKSSRSQNSNIQPWTYKEREMFRSTICASRSSVSDDQCECVLNGISEQIPYSEFSYLVMLFGMSPLNMTPQQNADFQRIKHNLAKVKERCN